MEIRKMEAMPKKWLAEKAEATALANA